MLGAECLILPSLEGHYTTGTQTGSPAQRHRDVSLVLSHVEPVKAVDDLYKKHTDMLVGLA